jgi:hypothetical protein
MSSWKAAVFVNLLAAFSIGALHAEEAKGYLVGLVHLTNKDWIAEYRSQNGPLLEKYGGRILVRGPAAEVLEGEAPEAVSVLGGGGNSRSEAACRSDLRRVWRRPPPGAWRGGHRADRLGWS